MKPEDLVVPPPVPRITDYPASVGIGLGIVFTTILLIVAGKFDPTKGTLTISIMIVLAFIGTVTFSLFFTIPNDQITAGVIGGLIAAFSVVVSHWIGKSNGKQ